MELQASRDSLIATPWYYQKWFVVLALLFVCPIGLVLLWRSPVTHLHGRIIWTVLAVLGFWIYIGSTTVKTMSLETPPISPIFSAASTSSTTPVPSAPPAPAPAYRPAPAYVAPSTRFSMSQYDRLSTGIAYSQAQSILGSPGQELSSSDIAGIKTVMYAWQNPDGSNLNAMFQNDQLMMKAQFGLK